MNKRHIIYTSLFLLLFPLFTAAQNEPVLSKKERRKQRPQYLQMGLGLNRGSMRDFATSPITYRGTLVNVSFGGMKLDEEREVRFYTRFNTGNYKYNRAEGYDIRTIANQKMTSFNYTRLYKINRFSDKKWNVKLGGALDVIADIRENNSLRNAGYGVEVFNTLFLSGKVTRSFIRKEATTTKIWFIKIKQRPRVILLSYQLNVPVINATIRNGYSYIYDIPPGGLFNFTKGYQFKVFSGMRFSSELAYTNMMHNGNAWRLSYIWDAFRTTGQYNRLEIANHIVEFSFLFHLNKNRS